MPATRIPGAGHGREVTLTFDGRTVRALEGEPVAASLLAAGRPILSRSFRFHRPRGLMCSTGQCGWCECEVDGVPSVRTCRVTAREGLVLRGEHALPSVDRDLLGVLDWGSALVPPTFYHHRFLRPRAFRKAYLDVIRWFGGRGRLPAAGPARAGGIARRELRRDTADVLVVGAGRSGIAAAAAAAGAGARVVVLEADVPPFWEATAGAPSNARALLDIRLGTVAVGWYDGVVAAIDGAAAWEIEAGSIVVATGSYERLPPARGADRPGVMAARLVASLVRRHGILPGRRAALIGEPLDVEEAGRLLAGNGATVVGTFPTASLVAVRGRRRVSGIDVRDGARTRREPVDLVAFGDRDPSLELLLAAGAGTAWEGDRLVPVLDGAGRTTVAGVYAVGGAAGRAGRPEEAARTGLAAARDTAPSRTEARTPAVPRATAPAPPAAGPQAAAATPAGPPAPPPAAAMACFCEDVRVREIAKEVAAGYSDPELLKRRTGALTGPCQGKYCLGAVATAARSVGVPGEAAAWTPPTARPPLRPVRLGDLAGPHALAAGDQS